MSRPTSSSAPHLLLLLFLILTFFSCQTEKPKAAQSASATQTKELRFSNLNPVTNYVGDQECAACHEEIFKSFKQTAMGRSFSVPSDSNRVEDLAHHNQVFDPRSNYHYEATATGKDLFQTEYRLDEHGQRTHELTRKVAYIVGSGNHARTYLWEENGFLFELPLTWFSKQKGWTLSPGYEFRNVRFSRPINVNCMHCHNSFAEYVPDSENRFSRVPHGIGCERCHGPGELHVERRYSKSRIAPIKNAADSTIVNPQRLQASLQMDVCLQCHLQGAVSIFKPGKQKSDFRPGMRLQDVMSVYVLDSLSSGDLRVASHGERFTMSACYVKSNGAFVCMSCHDPHVPVKIVPHNDFNRVCLRCHPSEKLSRTTAQAQHNAQSDCVTCHMPQGRTSDVVHTNFTDHWIRKEPSRQQVPRPNRHIVLRDFFTETDAASQLRLGLAYLQYYDVSPHYESDFKKALAFTEGELHVNPENEEALYRLGLVYAGLHKQEEALQMFRSLIAIAPQHAMAHLQLASVLHQMGKREEALESYRTALRLYPGSAVGLTQLGMLHLEMNNPAAAFESFQQAIVAEPGCVPAHNALGEFFMYQRHDLTTAKSHFLDAVHLDPDFIPVLNNLGLVELALTRYTTAEQYFMRVLAQDPNHVPALGNLALMRSLQKRPADAKVFLVRALQIDPRNARLKEMLSQIQASGQVKMKE